MHEELHSDIDAIDSSDTQSVNMQVGPQSNLCLCNNEAIEALKKRTGYSIVQENGQRRYGPPPNWVGKAPNRGCEVFVGKIPPDCFEDELVPAFEKIGEIYELRLMMNFNGLNRKFAFVMYTKRESAKLAVRELDNFEIRKDRQIGVCHSVDNCRLFVGGIPKTKKREEIFEELSRITHGVRDVIVYPTAHDKTKNRGFAFVEYESHRSAAMARRKLVNGRYQLWGHSIAVDWAEPELDVDEDIMATVKILYVRNLMLTTTEEKLKEEFEGDKPNSVERVKKLKDYAFIHFRERDDAINALRRLNGVEIEGSAVEVTFAKPVDKNQYVRVTRGGVSPTPCIMSPTLIPSQINLGPHITSNPVPIQFTTMSQTYPLGLMHQSPLSFPRSLGRSQMFGQSPNLTQEYLYDAVPGYEMPMYQYNPLMMQFQRTIAHSHQILEDICSRYNLGKPSYALHSTTNADAEGRELFLYKISIPNFLNGTQVNAKTLSTTKEEAKNKAAETALEIIHAQTSTIQQVSDIYNGTPMSASPASLAYQGIPLNAAQSVQNLPPSSIAAISTTPANPPNSNPVSNQALITNAAMPTQSQVNAHLHQNQAEYIPIIPQYYYDFNSPYVYPYQPQAPY